VRLRELQAGATAQDIAVSEAAVASAQAKVDASIIAEADARNAVTTSQQAYDTAKAKSGISASSSTGDVVAAYAAAAASANDAVNRLTSPLFLTDEALSFSANNFQAESTAKQGRVAAKAAQQRIAAKTLSLSSSADPSALLIASSAVRADLLIIRSFVESCSTLLNFTIGLSSSTLAEYQLNVGSALSTTNSAISTLTSAVTALALQEQNSVGDVTSAQAALQSSQASLNAATNNVLAARAALVQSQAELTYKQTGNRKEVVDGQRAQLAGAQGTLASLYADLAKRRLLAPVPGTVTLVDVRLGETAQPGTTVVAMNADGNFEIEVNVSEIDVGKVQVGDRVAITLDAFPGETSWAGSVATVNPSEKVVDGIIFYKTVIVFDTEDPRLKSGMTANLDIETGRAAGVLRVPLRAVKERGGKVYVQVMTTASAEPEDREVMLGIEDNDGAEVRSGLAEGDLVVVGTIVE
jgi:RND family efflux transporter MFP subunit